MLRGWPLAAALAIVLVGVPARAQDATPKGEFVEALGRFSVAVNGAYGDEAPAIAAALDAMADALARWDATIAQYERAIAAQLERAEPAAAVRLHLALGGLYLDRHRLDDARRELLAARALDPGRADVQALLGVAQTQLADHAAAAAFEAAALLEPQNPMRAYTAARQLADAGRAEDSIAVLRRLLDTARARAVVDDRTPVPAPFIRIDLVPEAPGAAPYFPLVRYADGFARLRRGEYADAIDAFREASVGDPLLAGSGADAMARAGATFRDGHIDQAAATLRDAIARAPDQAEPYRVLGHVLLVDRQFEDAVAAFRQAVTRAPGDERARIGLADALVERGQLAAARDALQETLAVMPESGRAHYALARAYHRESLFEQALRAFEASARFHPLRGRNSVFEAIGSLNVSALDLDAAIAAYGARVDLIPNDADAHHDLGGVYLRQNRLDEAQAEFTVALLLDPWHAGAATSLAQTFVRRQDHAAAAAAARRALLLDPEETEARYVLGTALVRLGRADEGRQELETLRRQQAEIAAARERILKVESLRRDAALAIAGRRFDEAVALRRQVHALDPSAFTHLELGLALLDAGEVEEAIAQLTASARLDGPVEVHRYLAAAYAAAGRPQESERAHATYERMRRDSLRRQGASP